MKFNISVAANRLNSMLAYFKRMHNLNFLTVKLIAKGQECYTDGETITIGNAFPLFDSAINTNERFAMLAGAVFHELGHVFYTPFRILVQARKYMHEGLFWPKEPIGSASIVSYIRKDKANAARVYTVYANLINILEDPRIEYLMLTINGKYGIFCSGLRMLRARMEVRQDPFNVVVKRIEDAPEDKKAEVTFSELFGLILYYGRFHCIKGIAKDEYSHPLAEKMLEIMDDIGDATQATTAEEFFEAANSILVSCFDDFIKPFLDTIKPEDESFSSSGNQDGKSSSSAVEKALGNVKELSQGDVRESQIKSVDLERQMKGEKAKAEAEISKARDSFEENEEKGKGQNTEIAREETEEIIGGNDGGLEFREVDLDTINSLDVSDIEKIESNRGNVPVRNYDESLKAPDIDYGSAHEGVKIIVQRGRNPGNRESEYSTYERFITLGKRTGEVIKPLIQKENRPDWQRNKFFGTKFSAARAANPNLRHFDRKIIKRKTPTVAFGILVDCSGSMHGEKIAMARAMAITCYEACKEADVDFGVFGHHTEGNNVVVDNYVYFDEKEPFAKYRLLSIDADGANRDGAAIRYVAEKLSKVNADRKVLIVISDGQPSHRGYHGTAAEEDIRRIIKEYKAKNVSVIAAAIDEDRERIKGIYGKDKFLAIDEPEKIPETILKLLRRIIFA